QQVERADQREVGRIYIAEHLRRRRVLLPLGVRDIDLRARLLSLIAVEDAQRDVHAQTHVERDRRIAREIHPEGGVRRTVGNRQLVVRPRLLDGLYGGLQIRPRRLGDAVELFEPQHLLLKLKWARDVELVHRRLFVEHHSQGDLGGARVGQRALVIALVLHPLQEHAVQVHARNAAGLQPAAEDRQLLVVVIQVRLRLQEQLLRLQSLYKGRAQGEEHGAFQVQLLRLGDAGGLLRALQPQFPLVLALVQIVHADEGQQRSEGTTLRRSLGRRPPETRR